MNLDYISSKKSAVLFTLIIVIAITYVTYLNRNDNIEQKYITHFGLSCSSNGKLDKSYLNLIPNNGSLYTSYMKVESCQDLVTKSYTNALLTVRKNKHTIYGLDLDEKNIIDFSSSKESAVGGILLTGILFLSIFFGYRVDQIRKARFN
jgi:hypothetical protein